MKRVFIIIIPVLVLGGLIAWRFSTKHADQAAMAKQRVARANAVPQVSVVPAQIRTIRTLFEATGTLESPLNVKISPKVSGVIDTLTAHEGDRVRRGEVLVRIDAAQVRADVQAQQAQLAQAQYRLAQALTTEGPTNVGIKTSIRQQAAVVASAQADHNQARQNTKLQVAAAQSSVQDVQGRVQSTEASIENARAAIASAQATLNNSRTKLNRLLDLFKQGFVSAQDVDDAKAAVAVQEAASSGAQGQLRSAQAANSSARAQQQVAEQQVSIVQTKGDADIEAAHQKLLQVKAGLELATANTAQSPAYRQGLEALQAAVAAQKAALASARSRLGDAVLTCPLDGFVTARHMDPGAMATPGQPILEVQFFRQVWVSVPVPDTVSASVHLGQGLQVTFDSMPGKPCLATVVQVNPSADAQARQFMVRAALANDQNLFRPGMFCHVSFTTADSGPVVSIPREALQRDEKSDAVFVVNAESKIEKRAVTVGPSDATYVAVTGVNPGENVVTITSFALKDGQEVKVPSPDDQRGGKGERGGGPAAPSAKPGQPGAPPGRQPQSP